jgi:hypothetical protein
MIAARYLKVAAGIRIYTLFHIFNPGTINAQWHFILAFASGRASVAAYTFAIIYNKTKIWGGNSQGKISGHPRFLR